MEKSGVSKNSWFEWFKRPQGLSVLIFIIVFLLFILYDKSYNLKQHPTGDEPHYLIVTQSLIKDHDLDLTNNYQNRDYLLYFPAEIDPHVAPNSTHGKLYPVGGVGIPILLIPFFLIKSRVGTLIFANLIGALLAANLYLLFWERTKNKVVSFSLALIGILTIPLSIYSFQIYPEPLAALIVVYALRKLPDSLWSVLFLAFLPWIHAKYCPLVIVFLIFLLIKKRYYYLIPLVLSLIGLSLYYKYYYGTFMPLNAGSGSWLISNGLLGIFVDRQFGLLAWSPFFLFFFFCHCELVEKRYVCQGQKMALAWYNFGYSFANCLFRYWQAGWSPPPRYLVPLIPLFLLPIAYLLNKLQDFFTVLFFGILSGVSLFLSWSGLSSPNSLYSVQSLTNNLFSKMGATNILPSFARASSKDWFLFFLLLIFIICVATYYNYRLAKKV